METDEVSDSLISNAFTTVGVEIVVMRGKSVYYNWVRTLQAARDFERDYPELARRRDSRCKKGAGQAALKQAAANPRIIRPITRGFPLASFRRFC